MLLFTTYTQIRRYKASNLYLCIVKVARVVLHTLINNPCVTQIRQLLTQLKSLGLGSGAFLFPPTLKIYYPCPGCGNLLERAEYCPNNCNCRALPYPGNQNIIGKVMLNNKIVTYCKTIQ